MSHSSDTMAEKKDSGYRSIHVRLPDWLLDRITAHAEAVGQTPSVEIRRALVEAFTEKKGCCSAARMEIDPPGTEIPH